MALHSPPESDLYEDDGDGLSTVSCGDAESAEGDDPMFDMFTGEVISHEQPELDADGGDGAPHAAEREADRQREREAEQWTEVAPIHAESDKDLYGDEQDSGAWISLPPPAKNPPTIAELRAINAAAVEEFDYADVPVHDEDTIRLVDILPEDDPDHGISLVMRTASLTLGNAYFLVVSHSPARSTSKSQVPCSGRLLTIPQDTEATLYRIRQSLDAGRWTVYGRRPAVWIDTVCMSCQDSAWMARNTTKLCRSAERLVVCLNGSRSAPYDNDTDSVDELSMDIEDLSCEDLGSGTLDQNMFSGAQLTALLQDSWFQSRWSVQPFALSKRRSLLLPDGRAMELSEFQLQVWKHNLQDLSGPMKDLQVYDSLRPQRSLVANLHHHATLDCELPHDIVYALLGISCGCGNAHEATRCGTLDCGLKHYSISYQQSLHELFKAIATEAMLISPAAVLVSACIRNIAEYVNASNRHQHIQATDTLRPDAFEWPSWVPDWRVSPKYTTEQQRQCIDLSFGKEYCRVNSNIGFSMDDTSLWELSVPVPSHNRPWQIIMNAYRGTVKLTGWVLERPQEATKAAELDWEHRSNRANGVQLSSIQRSQNVRHGCSYQDFLRMAPRDARANEALCAEWYASFIWPNGKYQPILAKMTEQQRRYQVICAEWPPISDEDLVMFLFDYQVAFIVRPAGQGLYRLVGCVPRLVHMTNYRFAWVDKSTNDVWAYGNCSHQPVELEII